MYACGVTHLSVVVEVRRYVVRSAGAPCVGKESKNMDIYPV